MLSSGESCAHRSQGRRVQARLMGVDQSGPITLTAAIDEVRIAPSVTFRIQGSLVPVRSFRAKNPVSSEPRRFGLFRNVLKTSVEPHGTTIGREGYEGP